MRAISSAKRSARAHIGLWPILERRNQLVRLPGTVAARAFEDRQVRALRLPHLATARVAVVIPTYRRAESLLAAVHSALNQTFTDLVVCVVDDGGGLPELPVDPRLHAYSLERNSGIAGLVRNVGIRLTSSEFIAFLDDDNTWQPDHVATLVAYITVHPELKGAYTSVRRLYPDGTEHDVLALPFDRELLRNEAFVDMNSLVVRRGRGVRFSVLRRSGSRPPAEDWELVWRLSRDGRFSHVPHATVNYTLNPGSYFAKWYPDEPTQTAGTITQDSLGGGGAPEKANDAD